MRAAGEVGVEPGNRGVRVDTGVVRIAFDRPEVRNAFRPQTLAELRDAFGRARDELEVSLRRGVEHQRVGGIVAGDAVERELVPGVTRAREAKRARPPAALARRLEDHRLHGLVHHLRCRQ